MSSDRFENTSHTASGIPTMRQCRRCPDGPSSASMSNPSSTARAAEWSRPTIVAASTVSRSAALSRRLEPAPLVEHLDHVRDQDMIVRGRVTGP